MKKSEYQARKNERGAALIATLSLLFTASLLVGALVVISQISTINIASSTEIMRSNYIAEGAANRVRFLIEADRYVHQEITETETVYDDYEYERYLPDAVDRVIDYYGVPVRYRILNANAGFNMGSNSYENTLNTLRQVRDSTDSYTEAIDVLADRIADYIDTDDETRDDGLEKDDYEELGMDNLPRNSAIQYREELLWIPDVVDILPLDRDGRLTFVRLMSISGGRDSSRPDIYTANYTTLRTIGGLDEKEAAKIMHALKIWRRDRIPLSDQLDAIDLMPVQNAFSFSPSSNYTIVIENATGENRPSARLVQSFTLSGIAGPDDETVRYLEWLRF